MIPVAAFVYRPVTFYLKVALSPGKLFSSSHEQTKAERATRPPTRIPPLVPAAANVQVQLFCKEATYTSPKVVQQGSKSYTTSETRFFCWFLHRLPTLSSTIPSLNTNRRKNNPRSTTFPNPSSLSLFPLPQFLFQPDNWTSNPLPVFKVFL